MVCRDCYHARSIHPFEKENGKFLIMCTKFKFKTFEDAKADCFEKFIGWAYR